MEYFDQRKLHSKSIYGKADVTVDSQGNTWFDRVLVVDQKFNVIAALLAIIASVRSFTWHRCLRRHDIQRLQDRQKTAIVHIVAALLANALVNIVIARTLATMLFDNHQYSTERESATLWRPTILVDISVIEVLVQIVIPYGSLYGLEARPLRSWLA